MLLESEPLGRAEYIVPLSILFGKEALGQAVFNESASLYECHQLAFKKITSELRPRVAWVRSIENGYDMPDLLYHETLVSHAGGFQTPNPLSHSPEYLFGSVDIVIDETRQVFGLEHFRRAYQIPAGSTVSAVNPLTGRVYKPDLLRNEEGAWDWRVHAWAQPEAALAGKKTLILHDDCYTSHSLAMNRSHTHSPSIIQHLIQPKMV